MKIGVTNFRVFKDRQEFDIKPITLLTGPNNAGKSAFTKLLELLKLGVDNLDLTGGRHNLGSFENAVNWESPEKKFKIDFPSEIDYLTNNLTTEITFVDGEANQLQIHNKEVSVFNFKIVDHDIIEVDDHTQLVNDIDRADTFELSFDYKYIIDRFFDRSILLKSDWSGKNFLYKKMSAFRQIPPEIIFNNYRDFSILHSGLIPSVKEESEVDPVYGTSLATDIISNRYFSSAFLINNVMDNIAEEEKYLLYDIIINGVDVTERFAEMLIKCQDEVFDNFSYFIPYSNSEKKLSYLLKTAIAIVLKEIHDNFLDEIIDNDLFDDSVDRLKLTENDLFRLIFKEKIIGWKLFDENSGMTFFEQFGNQSDYLEKSLSKVNFISAQRGNIDRVLLNGGSQEMNRVLLNFQNQKDKPNAVYKKFIKEAFEIFGINGELKIKTFENTIMVPYILRDGKEISFADLGFGYSQIIPIIIKIAIMQGNMSLHSNVNNILIIEEPEANLHPNLQSKLADLFALTAVTFPNLRLIIETHSEYIIRKLQFLTAKKQLDNDHSIIYYFNSDEYVDADEPKVKEIVINASGTLSEDFGPGFYDEAIRLRFDLMKLNSEQLN
ncbi:DUF3696 domain-containing protein [Kaistella jeonii]|uniref:AAA domain-containing protein n=1 Tax=Kaistella jeonii TaxID=266749 RepID=A0A0C1FP26_9FLAO|nr:DUF3696 domain-containing protein [Kaistella jeonii]KIA89604.1 hypothetical protein OA86_02935 [Kaistella jeonii]SFB90121.1 Protein of unknown function [Kaistella jeonii]VEI95814.1 Uncharacterized conserved protein [Kaistella jeonii]